MPWQNWFSKENDFSQRYRLDCSLKGSLMYLCKREKILSRTCTIKALQSGKLFSYQKGEIQRKMRKSTIDQLQNV